MKTSSYSQREISKSSIEFRSGHESKVDVSRHVIFTINDFQLKFTPSHEQAIGRCYEQRKKDSSTNKMYQFTLLRLLVKCKT